jgi:hypothetical protein
MEERSTNNKGGGGERSSLSEDDVNFSQEDCQQISPPLVKPSQG